MGPRQCLYIALTIFSWVAPGVAGIETWDESCRHYSGTILGRDDKQDPEDGWKTEGKIEDGWPMVLRLFLYLLGLGYSFYAVAIISDIFMAGIEKVTAKKYRKQDPATGRMVTAYFWNPQKLLTL